MEGGDRKSVDGVGLGDAAGVIPRAIKEIFEKLEANAFEYSVKVSFMELYNEELTDLLSVSDVKLKLMESGSGVVVQNIEEVIVKNPAEIFTVLDQGSAKRHTAETLLNKVSSRSHSIFTITIHMKESTPEGDEVIKTGKLNLVDLAGAENISRSGAKDNRAREAGNINQSLLTLGRVINALVEHQGHVPYRDSKLTRLLRDSLGGKTKTCIIATIAPSLNCQDETLSTLDYAHRAKNIRNKPEVNQRISKSAHIKDLTLEIDRIKAELNATRDKNGIYMPVAQYQELEATLASRQERIDELETDLQETKERLNSTQEELEVMTNDYKITAAELEDTQAELSKTSDALEQAKDGIMQRDMLIAAHSRSEKAIATHAENLTDELSRAADEISGLFAKIGRKESAEREVFRMLSSLQTRCQKACTEIEQEIGSNQSTQQAYHADIQDSLNSFRERTLSELGEMQAKLSQVSSSMTDLQQAATSCILVQETTSNERLETVLEEKQKFFQTATEAAKVASAEASRSIEELVNLLESQKKELQAVVEGQVAEKQSYVAGTRSLIDSTAKVLQGIQERGSGIKDSASVKKEQQTQALASLKEEFTSSLLHDSETMMSQISKLIQDFCKSKQDLLDASVSNICNEIRSANSDLSSSVDVILSNAQSHERIVRAEEDHIQSTADKDAETLKVAGQTIQGSMREATSGLAALKSTLQTRNNESQSLLEGFSSSTDCCVRDGKSEMKQAAEKAAQALDEKHKSGMAANADLGGLISNSAEADEKFCDMSKQLASQCSEHVNTMCDKTASDIGSFGLSVQDTVSSIEPDKPTSETPRKRDINVPPREWVADMRTPAHDVVLAELQRSNTDMGWDRSPQKSWSQKRDSEQDAIGVSVIA